MSKVVLGFSISLDGFINDKDGSVSALYPDWDTFRESAPLTEAIQNTGAAVMGRKTFEMGGDFDAYVEGYEFQVPIFVVTKTPPKKHPKETEKLTFTFVTDGVESAIQKAKAAAGGKDVTIVGGANVATQALQAGLADEVHMDIIPVLLGSGLRPFEALDYSQIKLEKIRVIELPVRTCAQFRVVR